MSRRAGWWVQPTHPRSGGGPNIWTGGWEWRRWAPLSAIRASAKNVFTYVTVKIIRSEWGRRCLQSLKEVCKTSLANNVPSDESCSLWKSRERVLKTSFCTQGSSRWMSLWTAPSEISGSWRCCKWMSTQGIGATLNVATPKPEPKIGNINTHVGPVWSWESSKWASKAGTWGQSHNPFPFVGTLVFTLIKYQT